MAWLLSSAPRRRRSAGRVFEPLRFADAQSTTLFPDPADQAGFAAF